MENINSYYQIIRFEIEKGDFQVVVYNNEYKLKKNALFIKCKLNAHLEAIHYLMYSFWKDKQDPRLSEIFDYVCIPTEIDDSSLVGIDFTLWSNENFLEQILLLKD